MISKKVLNEVFHKIELVPESTDITTTVGPTMMGPYLYKRLMFAVKNWPQRNPYIFYGKFSNIVQIHTVFILHHCIRSFKTEKECDERLDRVMTNPDESGLTEKYPKCQTGARTM